MLTDASICPRPSTQTCRQACVALSASLMLHPILLLTGSTARTRSCQSNLVIMVSRRPAGRPTTRTGRLGRLMLRHARLQPPVSVNFRSREARSSTSSAGSNNRGRMPRPFLLGRAGWQGSLFVQSPRRDRQRKLNPANPGGFCASVDVNRSRNAPRGPGPADSRAPMEVVQATSHGRFEPAAPSSSRRIRCRTSIYLQLQLAFPLVWSAQAKAEGTEGFDATARW